MADTVRMPFAQTPSDWTAAIEAVVVKAVTDAAFTVGKVVYEPGHVIGPDECCDGILAIDTSSWFASGEQWPQQRQPGGKAHPCGGAIVLNTTLKYATCVPTIDNHGALPPTSVRKAEHLALLDLGFSVWSALLAAESAMARTTGVMRVGTATPNPPQGGCGGFTIGLTTKLALPCP